MSNLERCAWWTLGVVALTAAAYVTFFEFFGHGPAIDSVFALLALTALPEVKGRASDEREVKIASKAARVGLAAFYLAFLGAYIAIGLIRGWDATLTIPMWVLAQVLMWAFALVLSVKATATVVLYRDGSHA